MRIPLLFLAAAFGSVQAHATGYGPYDAEVYGTCGSPTSPVAVELIHGGAWASGNGDAAKTQKLCQYLGANGIYAVAVDYRLSSQSSWPAQLQDAQLGLRWVRAISTAKRVGVIGTSAGGHIALSMGEALGTIQFAATDPLGEAQLLSTLSDRPDFVIDISGPTDLTDHSLLPGDVAQLIKGLGMKPDAGRAFASPIAHLTADLPPTLISHGVQDRTVAVGQSDEFVRAAAQLGITVKTVDSASGAAVAVLSGITYDRHAGGHAFDGSSIFQSALLRMIVQFARGTTAQ